jgi:hypothetical protein
MARMVRDLYGDPKVTCMDLGFTHDDGWFDLVWGLCCSIETLEPDPNFLVQQVKEKFGGLRFYVNSWNDAIREAIGTAEEMSYHICEVWPTRYHPERSRLDPDPVRSPCDPYAKIRSERCRR